MNESDVLVTTTDLTKRYGERLAVDSISMSIRRGEVYGFLGPNGAGKTTTLRMLLGLVRPTAGTAQVLGHPPGSRDALRGVGSLVEGPGFFPYLSGRDNLRVVARWAGIDESAASAALAEVDLTERASDRFASYSLGMKQRLGVAAALLKDPDVLVLDEPTNGLDPAGMADMRLLVRRVAAAGRTVVLSSHLLAEVQQVCDRIGIVAGGRLLAEGTVAEIAGDTTLVLRATPADAAYAVVRRAVPAAVVVGDRIALPGHRAGAADVVERLVVAGVRVHEVGRVEPSLEDVFMRMTTAGSGPAHDAGASSTSPVTRLDEEVVTRGA